MTNKNTNSLSNALTKWIIGLEPDILELGFTPKVDLQALEDRILYSAGPLPLDAVQLIQLRKPPALLVSTH